MKAARRLGDRLSDLSAMNTSIYTIQLIKRSMFCKGAVGFVSRFVGPRNSRGGGRGSWEWDSVGLLEVAGGCWRSLEELYP